MEAGGTEGEGKEGGRKRGESGEAEQEGAARESGGARGSGSASGGSRAAPAARGCALGRGGGDGRARGGSASRRPPSLGRLPPRYIGEGRVVVVGGRPARPKRTGRRCLLPGERTSDRRLFPCPSPEAPPPPGMDVANNTTSPERSPEGAGGPGLAEVTLGYQLLTSLLLGTLILCAVSGNACVIAAIALERSLQTVANYLIGSLAVTDLMVSVLVLPMAALYQVLNKWTLGQITCDIFISLDVLCCTSSILHLCAIALDRYWAITDPIDYVNKRTPRRAAVLISLTWLIGFLISIPPMLGWRTPEDRSDPDACTISKDHGYTIYSTFGAFYIPLLLMLVLYGRIFKAARFRIRKTVKKAEKKKIADTCLTLSPAALQKKSNGEPGKGWRRTVEPKPAACVNGAVRQGEDGAALEIIEVQRCNSSSKTHLPLPSEACGSPPPPSFERRNEKNTEAKRRMALSRERKTVKTLGIIMGTFILCWLPFFIVALVLPFCDSKCYMPEWLGAVINWLGYSNSLLNPIIYAYFNKDFQSAFKKIIKCKFCRQ